MKKLYLSIAILLLFAHSAFASVEPRPLGSDPRLRVITYNPTSVFKITGHYNYQSSIEFQQGEEIKTISMGDTTGWQIVPTGNRIFLKPIEANATTNMTLITNRRLYQFELHAEEAKSIDDKDMIFSVKFLYTDDALYGAGTKTGNSANLGPDLNHPEKLNFNYKISGAQRISPLKIFDDGEFTYFQFADKNAELPAFFLVDSTGNEALINYRIVGDYLVVERVTSQYTLRHGDDIVCVFNEKNPLRKDKKKEGFFSNLFGK